MFVFEDDVMKAEKPAEPVPAEGMGGEEGDGHLVDGGQGRGVKDKQLSPPPTTKFEL